MFTGVKKRFPQTRRNHAICESQARLLEPTFNRSVDVETKDERITSDGGVLLLREADHRPGLVESLASQLWDPRNPNRIRYTLAEIVRERLYGMAQEYSAQDDADRLAHDPAFKIAVWDRKGDDVVHQRLASQPTQSRVVDILSCTSSREALRGSLAEWTNRHLRATGADRTVRQPTIDIDSLPLTVYGGQTGGAYNGHYQDTVYPSENPRVNPASPLTSTGPVGPRGGLPQQGGRRAASGGPTAGLGRPPARW